MGCVAPCVLQRRAACLRGSRVDGRTRSGEQCNFYIFYEVDDEEAPTALRLRSMASMRSAAGCYSRRSGEGAARRLAAVAE